MDKILIHRELITKTAVTGGFSVNTIRLEGICKQIVVEPDTSTTSYILTITDDHGLVVFETETETGNFPELTELPMYGIYTVTISSATADEEFKIQLILKV